MHKFLLAALSAVFIIMSLVSNAFAGGTLTEDVVNSTSRGIAMDGFDVVAYFTAGAPAKGNQSHSYVYKGRKWLFSSGENKDLFASNPTKYEPQNHGWCAFAVANGYAAETDFIDGWFIDEGRLFITWSPEIRKKFLANKEEMLAKNAANWNNVHAGLKDGTVRFLAHSERPKLGYQHPQQLQ